MTDPMSVYLPGSRKKGDKQSLNLSINKELVVKARELNINLSALLEEALAERVRKLQRQQWIEENRDALEAYNKRVEEEGSFSDKLRSF